MLSKKLPAMLPAGMRTRHSGTDVYTNGRLKPALVWKTAFSGSGTARRAVFRDRAASQMSTATALSLVARKSPQGAHTAAANLVGW